MIITASCLALILVLSGCTRALMQMSGIDPDTIELRGPARTSTTDYDELAAEIPTVGTPLVNDAKLIVPTYQRVEEWTATSEQIKKVVLAYQKEFSNRLGSHRSLSEVRKAVVPNLTYNINLFNAHGLLKFLEKSGAFRKITIERMDNPTSLLESSDTLVIVDFSKDNQITYHTVSNGNSLSVDSSSMFQTTGTLSEFVRFIEWVKTGVQKTKTSSQTIESTPDKNSPSIEERLRQLKDLFDKKLINEKEYKMKKTSLLNKL